MKEYDYYVFDFDGTVSDTIPGVKNSIKYALSCFGITETDDGKLDYFIGPPLYQGFTTVYGADHDTANQMVAKFRERYAVKATEESFLYDGIKEMLTELKNRGKHLAIASSKPQKFVIEIAKKLEIHELFDVIVGETFAHTESSKKDLITEALKEMGADDLSKAIMTGDRFYDIEGAKSVGIDSAGAVYGFGTKEELINAGANYLLFKPDDLLY